MNFLRKGFAISYALKGSYNPCSNISSVINGSFRNIHNSTISMEKYYKITKIAKPVSDVKYKEGDTTYGVRVPKKKVAFPVYHYEAMFFKRQNRGLFGGLQRRRSKTCSEAKNKNLRAHLPNIVKTTLWSEALNKAIHTKATTTVLRTITKEGGLDNYLTKDKPARVKTLGLRGWRLRYSVLKAKEVASLPVVEKDGKNIKVCYIHDDGLRILVGKNRLLKELYPFVRDDSYTPISVQQFRFNHSYLTQGELVEKLKSYNYDFSSISA